MVSFKEQLFCGPGAFLQTGHRIKLGNTLSGTIVNIFGVQHCSVFGPVIFSIYFRSMQLLFYFLNVSVLEHVVSMFIIKNVYYRVRLSH